MHLSEFSKKLINEVDTILFADETKFAVNNGDIEDAIYYFGVTAAKNKITLIAKELKGILARHRYQGSTYHSTTAFGETRPRFHLMNDIGDLFIRHKLHCFCYKYSKQELFETTQVLSHLNNDILNFKNQEFQALFYFLISLNTFLRDIVPSLFGEKFIMYFDRNVYGQIDTEAFSFPDDRFVIKRMTFSAKSDISLLALPDFFGYLFRKAKISLDKTNFDAKQLETSKLTINSYTFLLKLTEAKLFHLLNINDEATIIKRMFNIE